MVHLSGGEWVVAGVVAVVGSVIGYFLSENDRRTLGRTPWGLPSLLWAVFWFLSLLLGLVLYLIAHNSEMRRAQHGPPPAFPGQGQAATGGVGAAPVLTVSERFPAYPRPANLQPDAAGRVEPAPLDPAPPEPAPPETAPPESERDEPAAAPSPPVRPAWTHSPAAWHPDPSGRFHYRWWDGTQWTSHVSTDGQSLIDTNPDQRIGPYD